jgi:hypothetical protein
MSEIRYLHTRAEVELRCGHIVIYNPIPCIGDVVYCQPCRDYSVVMNGGSARYPYTFLLTCDHCEYERHYHIEKFTDAMRIRSDTHRVKTRHTVRVLDHHGQVRYLTAP